LGSAKRGLGPTPSNFGRCQARVGFRGCHTGFGIGQARLTSFLLNLGLCPDWLARPYIAAGKPDLAVWVDSPTDKGLGKMFGPPICWLGLGILGLPGLLVFGSVLGGL
jgi:hypothetical protein